MLRREQRREGSGARRLKRRARPAVGSAAPIATSERPTTADQARAGETDKANLERDKVASRPLTRSCWIAC